MKLHEELLQVLRKHSELPHTYINPNFLITVTSAIEDYYQVEDPQVDEWVKDMWGA